MNPPWEIMMNFQKSLKPGAAGSDGKKTTQVQLSAAAQRFLPSSSIASSRIQKVRNIINESTRIIEESRLPELNNTTLNFCQNCTCDSCSNASILNGTQLNNPNVHILYQAFENFIKVQKQQFMAMIQQVASFDDTASTDFFTSCTPCNQPAVTECDSSESAKSMGAVSSSRESTQRNGATSTSSSRTLDTVDEGELSGCTAISENELKEIEINVGECIKDETSPTAVTSDTKDEKVKGSLISQDDLEVDLDGNSDFDFDNYVDDSFKPVRRSSILKMRESFVVLEKLETANQRQCDIKPSIPNKTGSIGKTVLVDKSNFTAPSNCENKMKAYAPPVEVSCTRSGRVLRKPQPYWTKGSRVGIKEEISDNNKDEPVLPRRGGHNVSHKIKPKQNVPKTRKHHIVSSSSDALAPSKTGVKRERKKKSTSHPDSTHATRDASKNMLAKKRKIESQTAEPSLMDSEYKQIPGAVAKSQSIRSKRSTRRGIQTENTDVALSNVKETTQREKAKNRILKPKKVDLRKRTGKGADNAVFQLKQGVRYPSLSGELSSETEPEYECYLNGNISD